MFGVICSKCLSIICRKILVIGSLIVGDHTKLFSSTKLFGERDTLKKWLLDSDVENVSVLDELIEVLKREERLKKDTPKKSKQYFYNLLFKLDNDINKFVSPLEL